MTQEKKHEETPEEEPKAKKELSEEELKDAAGGKYNSTRSNMSSRKSQEDSD